MENFRFERIEKFCGDLRGLIGKQSSPITEVTYKKGFFLTPEEADKSDVPFEKFDTKTDIWHGPDDHYWFRFELEVPESFDQKSLWLNIRTQVHFWDAVNPQFLLFVDNQVTQGMDVNHQEVKLTDCATVGKKYTIDLQAYTGRDSDQSSGSTSYLRLFASISEIDPRINELYYNLLIPNKIVSHLAKDSISRINLQLALEKAVNLLDLRVPYSDDFYASVDACNEFLREEIYVKLAGDDTVIATCIGHTHIDIAWWWTVEQTKEKVVRSFSTVLKLMEEYDSYKFMSSQPQLYKFLKDRYPDVYDRIKERVKEGRWEVEGGMWVEADCNVTSGESLVRQFLHGKKFFKEEFGKENKNLWLPDVFGYSAALPQILRKSGIDYFMTTKIAWNQFNKLPMDTFMWKGIDGTEVFTHLITTQDVGTPADSFSTTYNGMLDPICLMKAWERYQHKDINNDVLISFGFGDGGGGPTRGMLETGKRMEAGITGSPKVRMEPSTQYFDELYERVAPNKDLQKWVGELYLEYHRGTYTSMARNKRSNRKSELMLQDAEFLGCYAKTLGLEYQAEELYTNWQVVLLNQFHDILPGSSIKEVYEVTKEEYEKVATDIQAIIDEKVQFLADNTTADNGDIVLFNTLSFDRDDTVVMDYTGEINSVLDSEGNKLPVHRTNDGKIVFTPEIAIAKGYSVFKPSEEVVATNNTVDVTGDTIETAYYTIKLDEGYQFDSMFDKQAQRELIKDGGKGNVLTVYEDKPIYYDNWDIEIYYQQKSWRVDNLVFAEWVENNSSRAVLRVKREFLQSEICQDIIFYNNSKRIDFVTTVDWKQFNLLLKCEFDVDINSSEATYDIQFGNVKRPTHKNTSWDCARFEVCGHKYADLSEGGYGVTLMNDCKYGYGIHEGKMTMSLVKSGIVPNPTTDQEMHYFTYALFTHADNELDEIVQSSYALNCEYRTAVANNPTGKLVNDQYLSIDCDNVMVETVKCSEDGTGVIVRMYEFQNKRSNATIIIPNGFTSIEETNLMEEVVGKPTQSENSFEFTIKPFEIKTFKIK